MGCSGVYVGSAVDEEGDAVICGDEALRSVCGRCRGYGRQQADRRPVQAPVLPAAEASITAPFRYELLADDNGTVPSCGGWPGRRRSRRPLISSDAFTIRMRALSNVYASSFGAISFATLPTRMACTAAVLAWIPSTAPWIIAKSFTGRCAPPHGVHNNRRVILFP